MSAKLSISFSRQHRGHIYTIEVDLASLDQSVAAAGMHSVMSVMEAIGVAEEKAQEIIDQWVQTNEEKWQQGGES